MRDTFHGELDLIGRTLVDMSEAVAVAMSDATSALLDADLPLAEKVISDDAAGRPAAGRPGGAGVRPAGPAAAGRGRPPHGHHQPQAVADLERMGDLALHIAKIARMRYPASAVPDECAAPSRRWARSRCPSWRRPGTCSRARTSRWPSSSSARTTRWTRCTASCSRTCCPASGPHGMEPAIDMTLIGRYYERYADHAVSVARQVDLPGHRRAGADDNGDQQRRHRDRPGRLDGPYRPTRRRRPGSGRRSAGTRRRP